MLPIYKYREDKGSDNALELLKCGYPIREFRFGAECFVHQSPSVGKKAERGLSGTFILVLNHAVAGGLHKGISNARNDYWSRSNGFDHAMNIYHLFIDGALIAGATKAKQIHRSTATYFKR